MVLLDSVLTVQGVATRRLTRAEAMRHSGLTYRRLDYWCRVGVLGEMTPSARGSGSQRIYTVDAVHALAVCARVADCATPDLPDHGIDSRMTGTIPLRLLQRVVGALVEHRFPVGGYLLVCGDDARWTPFVEGVADVLGSEGGAWVVTQLRPDDRPE